MVAAIEAVAFDFEYTSYITVMESDSAPSALSHCAVYIADIESDSASPC